MRPSNKKILFFTIKIVVGIALGYILISKISGDFSKVNFNFYRDKFKNTNVILLLGLSLFLMPVNWVIESMKWKMIISDCLEPLKLGTAIKSVLTGVAFGNLAPGRATEFAGKILFISERNRTKAAFLHFVAGSSQLLVTILFGVLSIMASGILFTENKTILTVFILMVILVFILLVYFFLHPDRIFSSLQRFSFFKKLAGGKIDVPSKTLSKLFLLSVFRHLVFSLQYFLIIRCFFLSVDFLSIMNGIFLSYLLMSVIPMFSPVEAFMRGGIGMLVFGAIEPGSMNIFISSTLIWIINIVLPSVTGYFFFLFRKLNAATNSSAV